MSIGADVQLRASKHHPSDRVTALLVLNSPFNSSSVANVLAYVRLQYEGMITRRY